MDIVLTDGRRVRLEQLASVTDTVAEQRSAALLDGKPVVGFEITRSRGAGELEVANGVRAELATLKAEHPDISIVESFNFVDPVEENYTGSMWLLLEGALLAVFVVWLFLRDWRATLVSATALPLSILPAFGARWPNGNTMICEGATGRFFEVNREGKTLWEHINTFGGELTMEGHPNDAEQEARRLLDAKEKRPFVENNALFRATKFRPDYPGLAGRKLTPLAEQPIPFADLVKDAVARLKAVEGEKGVAEPAASPGKDPGGQKPPEADTPKGAEEAGKPAEPKGTKAGKIEPSAASAARN